jgi:CHASE2 domain-containing sensor protein
MEHLEGRTLQTLCAEQPLNLERSLAILTQIAEALDFAHANGVVHRDLKPANVFVTTRSGKEHVKILDFGLATLGQPQGADEPASIDERVIDTPVAHTRPAGTPSYMAPEVLAGREPSRASDVYAFGVMVYQVLTGQLPFGGSAADVIDGHRRATPRAPSEVASLPRELDRPVFDALNKEPGLRPALGSDLVESLRDGVTRSRIRDFWAVERPRRAGIAAAGGVLMTLSAFALAHTRLGQLIELPGIDARFSLTDLTPPDPRFLLLELDEASLAADPTPLAEQADEISQTLAAILAAGARTVAIDLLLPARWSASERFSDLVVRRSGSLTLAGDSSSRSGPVGAESIAGVTTAALGPNAAAALFGEVGVEQDADGVVRHGRLYFHDLDGRRRASWALHAAARFTGDEVSSAIPERFWIDHSIDRSRRAALPWKDVRPRLEREPSFFRERLVLVGATYVGAGDEHRIPGGIVSGLEVQASMVETLLRGAPYRDAPQSVVWLAAAVTTTLAFGAALGLQRSVALTAATLLVAANLLAAFLVFRAGYVAAMTLPALTIVVAAILGQMARSRLPRPPASATGVAR